MTAISSKRATYLAGDVYTDVMCFRIHRTDGVIESYSTNNKDLSMTEVYEPSSSPAGIRVYKAGFGTDASALRATAVLSVDNIDLRGIYDSANITRDDLQGGRYDDAILFVFATDYEDPIEDEHPMMRGAKGRVALRDADFTIEFRSLVQLLQQKVGRVYAHIDHQTLDETGLPTNPPAWAATTAYSEVTPFDLKIGNIVEPLTGVTNYAFKCVTAGTSAGSEPTWINTVGATTSDGTVLWEAIWHPSPTGLTVALGGSRSQFTGPASPAWPQLWWKAGLVRWLTGNNAGLAMEISDYDSGSPAKVFDLFLPMPFTIQTGDTYSLEVGYSRYLADMQAKFGNVANFGGFPYIPTRDVALQRGPRDVEQG